MAELSQFVMKQVTYPGFSPDPMLVGAGKKKLTAERINQVAQDFEGMFLSQMLQPMFEGIPTDGMFGGGEGEELFKSLQLDEYAKLMAKAGGIGIADHVKRELLRLQEV